MEPLALKPEDLARALEVLGPNLAQWRDALADGVEPPALRGGIIFAIPAEVPRLLDGINRIVRESRGIDYARVHTAVGPLCDALARLCDDSCTE